MPQALPGAQLTLAYDPGIARENEEKEQRDIFRAAVNAFGGPDALRAALGEAPSYLSKISEGMTGERPVQSRWWSPLAHDPRSAPLVANYWCRVCGFAPPAPTRTVTRAEVAEVSLAIDIENPMLWAAKRLEIARRLNVPVEQVQP